MKKSKKKVNIKKAPSYKQGWKDADTVLSQYSVWFTCCMAFAYGLRRKEAIGSNKKLFRYCEGFNDRIEQEAKEKGIKILKTKYNYYTMGQEDIGK